MEKNEYPYLYDMSDLEAGESWEQCIPKGWHARFKQACDCINEVLRENEVALNAFNIDQLKEKFGGIRCYWHLDDDCANAVVRGRIEEEIHVIIDELESDSYKLCNVCGEPVAWYSTGWVLPFCDKHAHENHAAACKRLGEDYPFETSWCKA